MTDAERTRVLLVTPNFDNNSLGRTYCLWLLCRELGWISRIVGVKGNRIWPPLQGTDFAADCLLPAPEADVVATAAAMTEQVTWADVVIAVKPLPTSFGAALDVLDRVQRPLMVDIDDPDIEARTSWRPIRERLPRLALSGRYRARERDLRRLGAATRRFPRIVSNPVLQRMYGGVIIPHVREPGELPPVGDSREPIVRFVGSPGAHKGVDVLREAIKRLSDEGFRLGVTASPPDDARPWEEWIGHTSIEQGRQLVASADIIALPSRNFGWARAQLPAKLMDAMMLGRPVVASDIEPIRWALGEPDLMVEPGSVTELTSGLRRLADPDLRARYSARVRDRAERLFSVAANVDLFRETVLGAIADQGSLRTSRL
jgi:glycosyltransferase involved in cell wall biosynthesis